MSLLRAMHTALILLALISIVTAGCAFAQIRETIPHLPNFIGRNICIGIEGTPVRPDWSTPVIKTVQKLGSEAADYDIAFDGSNHIQIGEEYVEQDRCAGLPLNSAMWDKYGKASFCLSSWEKNKYIHVTFAALFKDKSAQRNLQDSIYSIAACQFGGHVGLPEYGEVLKMDSEVHVMNPDYGVSRGQ
jgi:hypothetical protein